MKRPALFLLLSGLGWIALESCTPPRPDENAPLEGFGQGSATGTGGSAPQAPGGQAGAFGVAGAGLGLGGETSVRGCGEVPDPNLTFSKENLLHSFAACAELRYCEFEAAAVALSARAKEHASEPEAKTLTALRDAFRQSMMRWARADLFQFGPAASTKQDMDNGRGLRDLIYPWPSVSRCRVEEQLFGKAYAEAGFDSLVKVPINSRGLFAVEYLTFYEGQDNDCGTFSITNAGDAWANTPVEELVDLKLGYLTAVSADVAQRATELREAWSADGENFVARFVDASAYMDQHQALNIVAHSLNYVELELKDYKIGAPAGLYLDAPLERPELSFAGGGKELLIQNLRGFRDLFEGCGPGGAGLGFEDWLIAAGHGDLAREILDGWVATVNALESFPRAESATPSDWASLHATLKTLTDPLKTEFFGAGSPLGLTLPSSVEGDTD